MTLLDWPVLMLWFLQTDASSLLSKTFNADGSREFSIIKQIKQNTCLCQCRCVPEKGDLFGQRPQIVVTSITSKATESDKKTAKENEILMTSVADELTAATSEQSITLSSTMEPTEPTQESTATSNSTPLTTAEVTAQLLETRNSTVAADEDSSLLTEKHFYPSSMPSDTTTQSVVMEHVLSDHVSSSPFMGANGDERSTSKAAPPEKLKVKDMTLTDTHRNLPERWMELLRRLKTRLEALKAQKELFTPAKMPKATTATIHRGLSTYPDVNVPSSTTADDIALENSQTTALNDEPSTAVSQRPFLNSTNMHTTRTLSSEEGFNVSSIKDAQLLTAAIKQSSSSASTNLDSGKISAASNNVSKSQETQENEMSSSKEGVSVVSQRTKQPSFTESKSQTAARLNENAVSKLTLDEDLDPSTTIPTDNVNTPNSMHHAVPAMLQSSPEPVLTSRSDSERAFEEVTTAPNENRTTDRNLEAIGGFVVLKEATASAGAMDERRIVSDGTLPEQSSTRLSPFTMKTESDVLLSRRDEFEKRIREERIRDEKAKRIREERRRLEVHQGVEDNPALKKELEERSEEIRRRLEEDRARERVSQRTLEQQQRREEDRLRKIAEENEERNFAKYTSSAIPAYETTTTRVRYRLRPSQCAAINKFTRVFHVTDPSVWIAKNCQLAKRYFPQASCPQIQSLIESCFAYV